VVSVAANAVNQTATVTYDPAKTSVAELSKWLRDCGYHCAGRSVPDHVVRSDVRTRRAEGGDGSPSPHEMMGHGGHAGTSMDAMVRDPRNRFLVALVLSIPIMLWSPMGRDMLGFTLPAPFGMRDESLTARPRPATAVGPLPHPRTCGALGCAGAEMDDGPVEIPTGHRTR